MSRDAPAATLTLVFTDLEASTRLWERAPDAMQTAVERHDAILREAVERCAGRVVKVMGDGLMAVFPAAADAIRACLEGQRALHEEPWGELGQLRVRMGVHAGEPRPRGGDFYGPPVNRAARIMSAGHGGQVLVSAAAAELVADDLPRDAALRDLGEHRLKDLFQPERIFQLVHPALPAEFPPLATLSERPNNLPTQTSEFLGREAQLSAIRELLDSSAVRLLTLTGPGGIGKTRLALQAAADQVDRFADGVYFIDLSPVRDAEAAFEAIGRALGVSVPPDERLLDVLTEELRDRQVLLLLDNFEQVVEAADGVADLLRRCGELKVLVTSREALRVRGEHLLVVPPLSTPGADAARLSAELAAESDAVRLFVDRARETRADFALTDDNAPAVAEVCSRLDGLPLAIELAAARLALFSPDELRDRLRSRLELLSRGPRDLPARQRTLRSTIAWSYELLDEEEQALLRLLSVFPSAGVGAVEEVAGRLEPLRGVDVVERLTSLVDKSLVRSVDAGGAQRLSMLETIREYAVERLEEEPELAAAARAAHAEYFARLAHGARGRLHGPARAGTLAELGAEADNLLAAWRHWVAACDLEQLERLLDGLWALHDARGWYHAAVQLANDLLEVLAAAPPSPERAPDEITVRTSLARGLLAIRGYTEEVEEAYLSALALAEQVGELPKRLPVLRSLASFHLYRGEFDQVRAVGNELLQLAEQEDDPGLRVEAHLVLGSSIGVGGDLVAGLDHLERAIALFDPERDPPTRFRLGPSAGVVAHTTSAFLFWIVGRPDAAVERARTAVRLAERLDHPYTLAYTLFHVGFLDLWRREPALVHERARRVLDVAGQHEYQVWTALGLALRGIAVAALGRPEEGLALTGEGMTLYRGLRTPPVFWPFVLSLRARTLALAGRPAEGVTVLREALALGGERDALYSEFALLEGDMLLALGDAAGSEARFRDVLELSRELGARMGELRAATRLTRLRRAEGRHPDGSDALRAVYDTFDEGLETADLVEARAVLDDVQLPVG